VDKYRCLLVLQACCLSEGLYVDRVLLVQTRGKTVNGKPYCWSETSPLMTLRKALMNVDKAEKIGSISVDHWILDISGISGKVLVLNFGDFWQFWRFWQTLLSAFFRVNPR
jgi:hypothetical protein